MLVNHLRRLPCSNLCKGGYLARHPAHLNRFAFSSSDASSDEEIEYIKNHYVVHRRGDEKYGAREYLLLPPGVSLKDFEQASKDSKSTPLKVAALLAHRNIMFGARTFQSHHSVSSICLPLVEAAFKDCSGQGDQPQAIAALYGLSNWIVKCIKNNGSEGKDNDATSEILKKLQSTDIPTFEAVQAIATGIPREGHSVVGVGTYRDGEHGWRELAKEYISLGLADEVELYKLRGGEVVSVEHLADRNPEYLKSAGGAMARLFFL